MDYIEEVIVSLTTIATLIKLEKTTVKESVHRRFR